MKKPEMILFDYGHTLLYEPDFDARRCEEAVLPYIIENPQQVTAEQIFVHTQKLFEEFGKYRKQGIEIHEWQFMRLAYEYLGIKFSIPYDELEEIEWNAASKGAVMPGVPEMLDYLKKNKIRSAVISNIGWSGKALTKRISRLLPENSFEFIIASSEYAIRKPNKMIFEIALRKAGLSADQVWYCGDRIAADVKGSHNAGIFPVYYTGSTPEEKNSFVSQENDKEINFDYLHISDWNELIKALKQCTE